MRARGCRLKGANLSKHCLRDRAYDAQRAAVKSTNELVTPLAPVLNAPFADGFRECQFIRANDDEVPRQYVLCLSGSK
jgi:hypothetical protein